MFHATLMNEDFPARIEAVFPNRDLATAAAKSLCQYFNFREEQFSMVSPEDIFPRTHRNLHAFKASGRRLQKRQLTATLIAFTIVIVGLTLLHLIGYDSLPARLTYSIMAGLIIISVAITVSGLISWRPARIETRHKFQAREAVLIINVHDITEQYALREALLSMGARIDEPVSASAN